MCEPIDWSRLRGHDPSSPPDLLTIEATAVTGFEGAAASEVAEKFCIEEEAVVKAQGRVLFDIPEDRVEEVMDPLHWFMFNHLNSCECGCFCPGHQAADNRQCLRCGVGEKTFRLFRNSGMHGT